eukprot:TRINITY_DN6004_c0_g2_i3.p2 TRINITY_DN6004_c0_g2~~TRINITY_DN6004_c0_g2_i3.p2  ORF type:complete len:863 (-),score=363.94 TRINITY_DN6004_c0_g2_i3:318-2906(-)
MVAMTNGKPVTGAVQSSCPEKQDAVLARIKGSRYYEPTFMPPAEEVVDIDAKDQGTPDDWVPRHPELVRLTGRHPFNVEPPVDRLYDHGFITPASLHYVRNHGAVPCLSADAHVLRVGGAVATPLELTMEWLRGGALPEVTLPVTLVCAGNRRKEENMVRQGLGFSWGPAAVSTAMWTGVWLRDVLAHAGIKEHAEGAHHVCMTGADKLPNGYYGTSIRREVAMDPAADVLLAYKMNGHELTPDHGYPLRVIIPGYIGGRMIKWLTDITVGEAESDSHYHYFDNRVLPPQVDAERALAEGWWYKPQYIINELNINSAIVYPRHDEVIPLAGPGAKSEYTMSGYAYAGGGLAITRVEVSFDEGATWELAELIVPEKPRHMGRYWCWSFWQYKVDVARLLSAREITCRAWQGQNTQPKDLTWNVLGMMNNSHFRARIHPARDAANHLGLRFEHPTQPGPQPGGWMVKSEDPAPAAVKAAAPVKKVVEGKAVGPITEVELARHDSEADCWIAVEGRVYDVTAFLHDHPGGGDSITLSAGQDATDEFNALHSTKARAMLDDYYIGDLLSAEDAAAAPLKSAAATPVTAPASPNCAPQPREDDLVALNPKKKVKVPLIEREELTHDTRRFRFGLPSPAHRLGLPVGKHLFISGQWKGEFVMRAYTPVTGDEVRGYVDLVVKVYRPCERFPEGGKMSQLLDSLALGDTLDLKGPLGEIEYLGRSEFAIRNTPPRTVRHVGMLAGGTGITPMYQVARAVLSDPADDTRLWLLAANQTEDDILLRGELDALVAAHPGRLRVHYTVDRVVGDAAAWPYSTGFITKEMIAAHLPPAADDAVAFMCGPPPMLKFACVPNLQALGYAEGSYFSF